MPMCTTTDRVFWKREGRDQARSRVALAGCLISGLLCAVAPLELLWHPTHPAADCLVTAPQTEASDPCDLVHTAR